MTVYVQMNEVPKLLELLVEIFITCKASTSEMIQAVLERRVRNILTQASLKVSEEVPERTR
jgi:hypothetical protein